MYFLVTLVKVIVVLILMHGPYITPSNPVAPKLKLLTLRPPKTKAAIFSMSL